MKFWTASIGLLVLMASSSSVVAQFPTPSKEHGVLKMEQGRWNAEITMFMGPEGAYDPPQKSKGMEVNKMLGGFWLIGDFSGSFEGMKFNGRSQIGYDAKTKKYVGSWIDSFSPNATHMIGTYDAEKKTMTYETTGIGMDGKTQKGKQVVVYGGDKRTMTMYSAAPDTKEMIKVMQIVFTKAKKKAKIGAAK